MRCVSCESPLCGECVVATPVGFKCQSCTGGHSSQGAVGQSRSQPRRRSKKDPGARRASRRSGPFMAVAGVLLVAMAGFGLTRDGGGGTTDDQLGLGDGASAASDRRVGLRGGGGLRLGASFLHPGGEEPVPAVAILPGFGPTDRNGVAAPGVAPDTLYRDLAQVLGQAGVASVRYDKRGRGASVLPPDAELRFEDLVEDARGAVDFLADRAGIDGRRLAVVGHDEGGVVALRLAADDPRVRAVVLVSTPGRPLVEVLAGELRATAQSPEEGEALAARLREVVATVVAGGDVPGESELPTALRPVFPEGRDRYLRALFSVDPAADAADVHVPTLIVRGGRDPGIGEVDDQALAAAIGEGVESAVGHQADHTLLIATPLSPPPTAAGQDSHEQTFHAGAAGVSTARDDELLARMTDWLAARLGAGLAGELRVSATEFFYAPAELEVAPGTYRLFVANTGTADHELALHRPGEHAEELGKVFVRPGETRSFTVRLASGTYEMACHLPGHYEAGMRGRLRVNRS